MAFGVVYVHTNRANGKSYVGQTAHTMEYRWEMHLKCARSPKTPNYKGLFAKAIRKHGRHAFESQVLATASSQEELDNLEKLWIILLQSKAPNGYNLTDGGDSGTIGHKVSEDARKRLSEAAKKQWQNPEFRAKYSAIRTGKKMAPAAQEKRINALRTALCGKKQSPETITNRIKSLRGKTRTPEQRERMRQAHLGKAPSAETRLRMSIAQTARHARKGKEADV